MCAFIDNDELERRRLQAMAETVAHVDDAELVDDRARLVLEERRTEALERIAGTLDRAELALRLGWAAFAGTRAHMWLTKKR